MTSSQKVIKAVAIALAVLIIATIINGVFILVSSLSKNDNTKTFEKNITEKINNIKIDVDYANIELKKGNNLAIDAQNVSEKLIVQEMQDTLTIKERKTQIFSNKKKENITITIPNELSYLEINMDAGKLDISDITSNKTKIDAGAGKVKVVSAIFKDLELDLGAGKFYYDGYLKGNCKIEQGLGEITLNLKDNDYTFIAEKGLGSIKINNESYKEVATKYNGTNIINIEGGIGNIDVNINYN